jgi:hypothetical protein
MVTRDALSACLAHSPVVTALTERKCGSLMNIR